MINMITWFLKKRAKDAVRDEAPANRIPDEVLAKKIEARLSAGRIRKAVEEEFSSSEIPTEDPLENTFDVPLKDGNDLVFIADGSNIGVEEVEDSLEYIPADPAEVIDFGRDVNEVETAWGTLPLRDEAMFKKELKAIKK